MNNYVLESMARVGCGVTDTQEIAVIVETLPKVARDTLDAMHNFGIHATLTPEGNKARADLTDKFSDDDLVCLATYVNAYRNTH